MKKLFNVLLIGLLLFALFGCMIEPYEPACIQGEYTHGTTCTEVYDPVCAPDGTTYSNQCYAIKDGWDLVCVEKGECED